MDRIWIYLTTSLVFLSLAGCAGFTEIQHSISNFDQAAHAAVTAEGAFIDADQIIDCEDQFYSAALLYSIGKSDNFNLTGYCIPRIISPEEIATRKAIMNAIALYADKLQALASDKDDKQLDDNSKTLAQKLNGLASSGGVKLRTSALVPDVEAAFSTFAKMILDQVKYKDVRDAAQSMQKPLTDIVKALNDENFGLGETMAGSLGKIEIDLRNVVVQSTEPKCAVTPDNPTCRATTQTFFSLLNSRAILIGADPLTKHSLASPTEPGGPSVKSNPDVTKPVTEALNALVNANSAIANTGPGGINASVQDLYQRANSAKDMYNSLISTK